jgi:hypothetical protein
VWKTYEELLEYRESVKKKEKYIQIMYDNSLRFAKVHGKVFCHPHILADFS